MHAKNGQWNENTRVKWVGSVNDPRLNEFIDNQFKKNAGVKVKKIVVI